MRRRVEEPVALAISPTLARRILYAGVFFYASFFIHGHFAYDRTGDPGPFTGASAQSAPPLERGLAEPLPGRVLGVTGRPQ